MNSVEEEVQRWADEMFEDGDPTWSTPAMKTPRSDIGSRRSDYQFGAHSVILSVPKSSGSSLSVRVWRGALVLARALIRERDRLQGRTVLELGAGMGLCGLLVSKLGALEVVITDCHYPGLKVLLGNVLAAEAQAGLPPRGPGPAQWGGCGAERAGRVLSVRRHLWETDVPRSPGRPVRHWSNDPGHLFGAEGSPPELEPGAAYDVVCAADVLYFHDQVWPLLHTLSVRCAVGGMVLLTVTLRNPSVFAAFLLGLEEVGMEVVQSAGGNVAFDVDPLDLHYLLPDKSYGDKPEVNATANELGPIHLLYIAHIIR
mmetsp:Transcript_27786/g.52590  ORF Transcript_27786/g.52590 Transcript_27786/m.52590 type:complete len:314 (-) Transcript_27786:255-1196(-)